MTGAAARRGGRAAGAAAEAVLGRDDGAGIGAYAHASNEPFADGDGGGAPTPEPPSSRNTSR